jgi:hypothetical protein
MRVTESGRAGFEAGKEESPGASVPGLRRGPERSGVSHVLGRGGSGSDVTRNHGFVVWLMDNRGSDRSAGLCV